MRECPGCRARMGDAPACGACGGLWWSAGALTDRGIPLGPLRRLVGKGPLTSLNCADCRNALKSIDLPGPVHEGDLFWGLETARPAGTSVAEGCPRCGGVFVGVEDVKRSGGREAFLANLDRVARGAS